MAPSKVAVFSSKPYDETYFLAEAKHTGAELHFLETRLNEETVSLCANFDNVCVFVNDIVNKAVITQLYALGVKHIALRCAGFNNVDIECAKNLGIKVSRVPAYSPEAVAEHTVALILALNRKLHKAYNRVKEDNFSLVGLLGFNLHGKTVGIIGTGRIGSAVCRILNGFGCRVLGFDVAPDDTLSTQGITYTDLDTLITESNIITLHCPLNKQTNHLINTSAIEKMQENVMLINTSRGALVDTEAVIKGLKSKKIGHLGLDVYEMESELFFEDLSDEIILDDQFQRLLTFPNVLITGHQGFFTKEALTQIAQTTLSNIQHVATSQGHAEDDNFLC
ncbi:2-hydroxyacid dehydrogenase [Alteromonas sp. a30]|uniref:2-hydroxyacid dehydrogenase n=1 Tax=Alteromonas sp. a30 TaxID=2730917 RepID=UPI002281732F|nr:2-hydroxyacid dehydrogenase [Alteromonas sp. a30]MCY7296387.1 2-hydroxyacid dehydrogenase [Alteromonas sp. a30]